VKVEKVAKNGEKGQNSQPLSPRRARGDALVSDGTMARLRLTVSLLHRSRRSIRTAPGDTASRRSQRVTWSHPSKDAGEGGDGAGGAEFEISGCESISDGGGDEDEDGAGGCEGDVA
jgi:hypothetical protein